MSVRVLKASICSVCRSPLAANSRADHDSRGGYRHTHNDRVMGGCVVASPVAAEAPSGATTKQVGYALDLQTSYWTPAVFGGARYDRQQLEAMDKIEVSRVIATLLTERGCQVGF